MALVTLGALVALVTLVTLVVLAALVALVAPVALASCAGVAALYSLRLASCNRPAEVGREKENGSFEKSLRRDHALLLRRHALLASSSHLQRNHALL